MTGGPADRSQGRTSATEPDVVCRAAPDAGVFVGHSAPGQGLARIVTARQTSPQDIALVGVGPLSGGIHHGINARGLVVGVCAGSRSTTGPLVSDVLERARSVSEALDVVRAAVDASTDTDVALWLADRDQSATVTTVSDGIDVAHAPRREPVAGDVHAMIESLRARSVDNPGAILSTLVAHLAADGTAAAFICLGPPACGVFVRYWPGIEVGPLVAGSPDGPPEVAAMSAALARGVDAGLINPSAVRERLDEAEAATLAEGEDAERMARIMDAHGDRSGAEARRVVAIGYSVGIAREALGRLLGPAGGADL